MTYVAIKNLVRRAKGILDEIDNEAARLSDDISELEIELEQEKEKRKKEIVELENRITELENIVDNTGDQE